MTTRWRRRPDVLWRRSLDTVLLLPAATEDVVTLAGTGPAVWELLAEWRTLDDLAGILAGAFESTPEVVMADLVPLLAEFEVQGVVQTASDSGGPGAG